MDFYIIRMYIQYIDIFISISTVTHYSISLKGV